MRNKLILPQFIVAVVFLFLACEKKIDKEEEEEVIDNKNTLTSLVLKISEEDAFTVVLKDKKGTVSVPYNTELSKLKVKSVTFSPLAKCSLNVGDVITLDENNAFDIIITAKDNTKVVYTVTINEQSPRTGKKILSFKFLKAIDDHLKEDTTFDVKDTDITGVVVYLESNELIPVFEVSPGATVKIKGVPQTSGESTVDFTSTVAYTVIPEDPNETAKTYIVTVDFYYDKLTVTSDGVLSRKDMTKLLTGKLVLADKMNGQIITSIANKAFYECSGLIGNLTLPNSLEEIGQLAFAICSGFTGSLTIPNSVTSIGDSAFIGCKFTGELKLPDNLERIGQQAFQNCSGFTASLTIPNSVVSIGKTAFNGCSGFNGSLTLSNNLGSIAEKTFNGCTSFTGNLTIPNSIKSLGEEAFMNCGFDGELKLSDNLKSMENRVFKECKRFTGSLTIPDGITRIGVDAFLDCNGFNGELKLSKNLTKIGDYAFKACGFTGSLVIPDSVKTIQKGAFLDCKGFDGTLTLSKNLRHIYYNVFTNCENFTGNLDIPNGVGTIEIAAFENCKNFKGTLTIPASVKNIGDYAFFKCTGFTKICNNSNPATIKYGKEPFKSITIPTNNKCN